MLIRRSAQNDHFGEYVCLFMQLALLSDILKHPSSFFISGLFSTVKMYLN